MGYKKGIEEYPSPYPRNHKLGRGLGGIYVAL